MLHQYKAAHYNGGKKCKLLIPLSLQAQVKHKQVGGMAGEEKVFGDEKIQAPIGDAGQWVF